MRLSPIREWSVPKAPSCRDRILNPPSATIEGLRGIKVTNEFPETAAEFYARRDDRTNRYLIKPMHATKGVRLTADYNSLETVSGQLIFLVSCNLLSRWCRTVYLDIRDIKLHPQL